MYKKVRNVLFFFVIFAIFFAVTFYILLPWKNSLMKTAEEYKSPDAKMYANPYECYIEFDNRYTSAIQSDKHSLVYTDDMESYIYEYHDNYIKYITNTQLDYKYAKQMNALIGKFTQDSGISASDLKTYNYLVLSDDVQLIELTYNNLLIILVATPEQVSLDSLQINTGQKIDMTEKDAFSDGVRLIESLYKKEM